MGLKCSILGHSFEPTGTETERQEQGSEVVTVVRELEECTRCGEERVVSETTEVTTVVDADEVDIDESATATDIDANAGAAAGAGESGASEGGAFDAAVDRSGDEEDAEIIEDDGTDPAAEEAAEDAAAAVDELAETPDEEEPAIEDRDPEEEDAEILTDDDEPDRDPGEWPDDEDVVEAHEPDVEDATDDEESDAEAEADPGPEPELEPEPSDDEDRLAGITVPEGTIVCPECGFSIDAESSYRDGDPCPECGAWLVEDDE